MSEERNKLIAKLYSQGLRGKELFEELQRAGFTGLKDPHSLSGIVSRLKRKGMIPGDKSTSRQVPKDTKDTKKQVPKYTGKKTKVSYYLPVNMVKIINALAGKNLISRSDLVKKIIYKYLSRQGDL